MQQPKLTVRKTDDHQPAYRVLYDDGTGELEIGSIARRTRHTAFPDVVWHWSIDVMPLMDHGGRTYRFVDQPYGTIDRTSTNTTTSGGALQMTVDAPFMGHGNNLAIGASFLVNFSLSHFVVFRRRSHQKADPR